MEIATLILAVLSVVISAAALVTILSMKKSSPEDKGEEIMRELEALRQELADPYLERYCKVSGTSKKYVQAWLPIVAAAQLEKNIEEEHDFLMRWIDVFDYQ